MKILFIFTGGTIGSTLQDGYIGPAKGQGYRLLSLYRERYGMDFAYDVREPYTALSENNTGHTLRTLIGAVADALPHYDGIVVTHGTDTLQYTAAALGVALGQTAVPVCIVSANYPVADARSNALPNLHAAVRLILGQAGKGVLVPYQNGEDKAPRVYRGTRLLQSLSFTDRVMVARDMEYGRFLPDFTFVKNKNFREQPDALPAPDLSQMGECCPFLLRLFCHVGMTYPQLDAGVRFVLLEAYHSGTVNTASHEARAFYERARERGVTVFVTGVTGETAYESARSFAALGLVPLSDIAPIAAFLKLWLYAPNTRDEAKALLFASRGGDCIV